MNDSDNKDVATEKNHIKKHIGYTPSFAYDAWFYRIALIALSLVAVGGMVSAITLAILDITLPDLISNLASAAVGALAGLLAGIQAK